MSVVWFTKLLVNELHQRYLSAAEKKDDPNQRRSLAVMIFLFLILDFARFVGVGTDWNHVFFLRLSGFNFCN